MLKQWFAERNGYKKVDDVLVRERLTEPFINGVINMYLQLAQYSAEDYALSYFYTKLDRHIHAEFLRKDLFSYKEKTTILNLLRQRPLPWYELFSLLECSWDFYRTMGLVNMHIIYAAKRTESSKEKIMHIG